MSLELDHRPQGLFVSARSALDVRRFGTDALLALLSRPRAYNLRVSLCDAELAVCGWLPPSEETQARRRGWLVAEALDHAARLVEEAETWRDAERPAEAPPDAAAGALLESLRQAAARTGASVQTAGSASLRIEGPPHEGGVVFATASDEGLLLRGALPQAPARSGSPRVRAARAHAALLINARLVFARVVPLDRDAAALAVETRLPVDPDEDELACALDGVRWGLREAEQTLRCLASEDVAAEYAAAQELRVG